MILGGVVATDAELAAAMAHDLDVDLPGLQKLNSYYDGTQPLSYMAPELVRELSGRVRQVVVNWPRLVVDSLEERLDIEGFRINQQVSARLWRIWQDNDLDEQSQQAHVDALVQQRAYVIIGSGDDPARPVISVESPEQVMVKRDPRTRQVVAAVKRWSDDERSFATLYRLNSTHAFEQDDHGDMVLAADVDEHNLGAVPVVPLVTRPRTLAPGGVSELADVIPLSDAACKTATDMMISQEFHAMPRRWVVGMTEADMTGPDGKELSKWSKIAGRIWASGGLPSEVQMGQFQEADLRNFHETMNSLARVVAALAGLPPHFLGYSDDNPASADAIRSAETRLVKRAERRQKAFGGAWEQVMRLALMMTGEPLPDGIESLETVWRDASTPTVAQKADAAVKLRVAGITPLRQTREDLGYSPVQITQMEVEDSDATARILAGDFTSLLGPKPAGVEDAR